MTENAKQKLITMEGAGAKGGAKAGSLRLIFSSLASSGLFEVLNCCSHVPELLKCLLPAVLVDKE